MDVYRFAGFEMRPRQRTLWAHGSAVEIGSRAYDVLLALVQRPGELVTKDELLREVWPSVVVSDNNLTVQISTLRKVLGTQLIATIPGRGYRLAADVESGTEPGPVPRSDTSASLHTDASSGGLLPLIGRDDELITLRALADEHRMLTIVGAGGIGKTHLVRHLISTSSRGTALAGRFVDLSDVAREESSRLAHRVATRLGIQIGPGPAALSLGQALRGHPPMQLVLDNAEHLVDDVARLAQALLECAPDLRLIVTSQTPLNVPGERVFRLGGLALPDGPVNAEQAIEYGAIEIFVDRVQALDRRFTINCDNVDAIVNVCSDLDGLPLALELAAARVPSIGVRGVAAALEHRFQVLGGSRRLAPPRQQTLHAALEWSHDLLAPDERTVFRRLGVFAGPFPLDLAQQVARDDAIDEWEVLDALGGLVNRSLVVASSDDPPDYRMLESPRAYAREMLSRSGEESGVSRRHARALRERLWQADLEWMAGHMGVDAYRTAVGQMLADAKAALAWAVKNEPASAVALAPCLDWALVNEPPSERGAHWASTYPLVGDDVPSEVRARWWTGWNHWALQRGDLHLVEDRGRAVENVRALNYMPGLYWILQTRLWLSAAQIQAGAAIPVDVHRYIEQLQAIEDPRWSPALLAMGERGKSDYCRMKGDWDGAIGHLRNAARLAHAGGDSRGRWSALVALVDAELSMERYREAAAVGAEVVDGLTGSHFESTLFHARHNLALARLHLDDHESARTLIAQSMQVALRFRMLAILTPSMALLLAKEGDCERAAILCGYAGRQAATSFQIGQSNEARALREAERISCEALGMTEVARLKAQGSSLDEADLKLAISEAVAR